MTFLKPSLRKLRTERQYTQEYVAGELRISQEHYSRIESGKLEPRRELREKIAQFFGVSVPEAFYSVEQAEKFGG